MASDGSVPAVADMDLAGFRLHSLRGQLKGFWAVTVRANWRVIFRFDEHDAPDLRVLIVTAHKFNGNDCGLHFLVTTRNTSV
jgi:hypothetical protein